MPSLQAVLSGFFAAGALTLPPVHGWAEKGTPQAEMVVVLAGEFFYGDDQGELDERPVRRLYLPSFAIDRTEVTVGAYQKCVSAGRCAPAGQIGAEARLPIVGVSFDDAKAYCTFVGKRLPSETEWEKAARGSQGLVYPWGNVFECGRGNFGNFGGDGRCADDGAIGRPMPVGSFPRGASPYGLLDMAGNVWEWVLGRYDWNKPRRPELRVLRGGGCCSIFGLPRTSDRLALPATYKDGDIGFRCASSLSESLTPKQLEMKSRPAESVQK